MNKKYILHAFIIAFMYTTVTAITWKYAHSNVQLRVTEALCVLPMFTPAAVPGLFIGCLFANGLSKAPLADIIFGSAATLIGALGTWKLRDKKPYIALIPPIVVNALVVPIVLRYSYGIEEPVIKMILTVGLGEIGSCGVLGCILYYVLRPHKEKLFGYTKE